jgi:polyisoprenoid-binding protein YceI
MTESASATILATGSWEVDPGGSTAGFVAHQLGHAIPGTIPIRSATVEIGPERDIRSAHIELDIAAIATGIAKRDLDLAKPRLLDTAHHPTLSVDVAPTPWTGNGWSARGTIGVRGIEFPVDLSITLENSEPDGVVRVLVTAAFSRKPIGMKVPAFVIGNHIEVSVHAVFNHRGLSRA